MFLVPGSIRTFAALFLAPVSVLHAAPQDPVDLDWYLPEEVSYDAFFCSAAPNSSSDRALFLSRVAEHSEWIQMLLP